MLTFKYVGKSMSGGALYHATNAKGEKVGYVAGTRFLGFAVHRNEIRSDGYPIVPCKGFKDSLPEAKKLLETLTNV